MPGMDLWDSQSVIGISPIHSLNSFDNNSKSYGKSSKSSHCLPTSAMKKSYPEDVTENSSTSTDSKTLQLLGFLRCLECPKTFQDNSSLRQHFLDVHKTPNGNQKSTFSCTNCNQSFPCPVTLKVHKTEHVLPNVQQISSLTSLKNGTNRLLFITFACHICDASFSSRELLVDHANVHLLGHNCENTACQETYSFNDDSEVIPNPPNYTNISNISNTNKNTTPELFNFKCESLPKSAVPISTPAPPILIEKAISDKERNLKTIKSLKEQRKSSSPKSASYKPNNNCKASNQSSTSMEPTIVKGKRKLFQCNFCHKLLSSKLSHEEHLRTHTGEKPYRCWCEKKFAVKNTYRQHMASHKLSGHNHNVGPTRNGGMGSHNICTPLYKCSLCLDNFSCQDKLDYHSCLGRGNKQGKGFICKICGKIFATKESRKKHYLSHDGESCFKCDICGSIFVDEQIYLIHAQDHFSPKEIKKSFLDCNICCRVFPCRDMYERHSCRFAAVNSSG